MSFPYPNLFSKIKIGNVTLKNRVVMSAMDTCYFSIDGTLTPKAVAHYLERARGGVGMIVTEVSPMDWPAGKNGRREPRFNDPLVTTEWSNLIEAVHSFGCKILQQIGHAGFIANPHFCEGRDTVTAFVSDAHLSTSEAQPARTIRKDEILSLLDQIRACAVNINSCGFDGIELHAAHDYLFNEFLSPYTNRRTDEYGGSTENRARFLLEAIRIVREELGSDKIVSVRLPVREEIDDGITVEEGIRLAALCEEAGADLIDCSIGMGPDGAATEAEWMPDGRRIPYAAVVKPHMKRAKVGVVGKLRAPEQCEEAIANGSTDLVFLARALLTDPHWAIKAQSGRANEIRKCLSCREGCFAAFRAKSGSIRCVVNPYVGFEDMATEHSGCAAANPKKLLIVGGGISGMQAAIIAKKRGHDVTLAEQSGSLGGQMRLAHKPPHKDIVLEVLNWFAEETARMGGTVLLNTTVDDAFIEAQKPDAVLLAVGSEPVMPHVEGIGQAIYAWDILSDLDQAPSGREVVIIGGGTVGCEVAQALIERDNRISIIELDDGLSKKRNHVYRQRNQKILEDANARILLNCSVQKIDGDQVLYRDAKGSTHAVSCEIVVCAVGQAPRCPDWESRLRGKGVIAYTLGDATETGDFQTATRSAMDIVLSL